MKLKLMKSQKRQRAELRSRVERLMPVIGLMASAAMTDREVEMAQFARSPELHEQFDSLGNMTDAQLEQFLDMLEAGLPKEYKDLLKREMHCVQQN
jgi:hypothetical protein